MLWGVNKNFQLTWLLQIFFPAAVKFYTNLIPSHKWYKFKNKMIRNMSLRKRYLFDDRFSILVYNFQWQIWYKKNLSPKNSIKFSNMQFRRKKSLFLKFSLMDLKTQVYLLKHVLRLLIWIYVVTCLRIRANFCIPWFVGCSCECSHKEFVEKERRRYWADISRIVSESRGRCWGYGSVVAMLPRFLFTTAVNFVRLLRSVAGKITLPCLSFYVFSSLLPSPPAVYSSIFCSLSSNCLLSSYLDCFSSIFIESCSKCWQNYLLGKFKTTWVIISFYNVLNKIYNRESDSFFFFYILVLFNFRLEIRFSYTNEKSIIIK